MQTKFIWVPEAPKHSGYYASEKTKGTTTNIITNAKQFQTYEECLKWCNDNPHPKFMPVEHGIY